MVERLGKKLNLIRELALKDLKVRYSRPALGFLWAFLSPLLTVAIFYIVFGIILKVKTEEAPFVLYLMSGVFPWMFFQDSIFRSVTSLADNKNLIKESNFPIYLIPISIVITNGIIFLPSLFVVVFSSLFVLKGLPFFIILLPVVLIVHLIITMLLSVIFSILYVRWRDLKYILEAIFLLLFYLTPIFYPISLLKGLFSDMLYKAYVYNPLVGILILYRVTLLKGFSGPVRSYAGFFPIISVLIIFVITISVIAIYLYRKNRGVINDHLAY